MIMNQTISCNICEIDKDARVYDKQTGHFAVTFSSKDCKLCGELFYVCSLCESVDSTKKIHVIKTRSFYWRDSGTKDWRLKHLCSENCRQVWDVVPKEEIVNER